MEQLAELEQGDPGTLSMSSASLICRLMSVHGDQVSTVLFIFSLLTLLLSACEQFIHFYGEPGIHNNLTGTTWSSSMTAGTLGEDVGKWVIHDLMWQETIEKLSKQWEMFTPYISSSSLPRARNAQH